MMPKSVPTLLYDSVDWLCGNGCFFLQLFNAQNINQTLQLVFNMLVNAACSLSQRYAADLLIDLVGQTSAQHALARSVVTLPEVQSHVHTLYTACTREMFLSNAIMYIPVYMYVKWTKRFCGIFTPANQYRQYFYLKQ